MTPKKRIALGIDFGTESVRALFVDTKGNELASSVVKYKHGQITENLPSNGKKLPANYALQHPSDWIDASVRAVKSAAKKGEVDVGSIIGIGVDFTSCTMLPVKRDGTPLEEAPLVYAGADIFLEAGDLLAGCNSPKKRTFGYDAGFLKEHTDAVVLKKGNSAIVVVPEYQGRVMTATAQGDDGASSGWINYDVVKQGVLAPEKAKDKLEEHMYAFGGEERFWMGPEGGQYSIFFAPGKKFEFADWFTPDPIDNEPWDISTVREDSMGFIKEFALQNHSGTEFKVGVQRTVKLLDRQQTGTLLGATIPDSVDFVAYQSVNTVSNKGDNTWKKESGTTIIRFLVFFARFLSLTEA
ncbi:MAG: DUF6786 family protein [Kiritimatiellia bacterium]